MKAYAASEPVDIISVFVDKSIAWDIWDNLNWFTNKYIGRNYNNAKVMLFQINTAEVTSSDMVKINQNLFLEWEKNWPSRLVWTILIGDISLPVVNKQGFIFPTVYPLVDFIKPKYYYNPVSDYFEYQSEGNGQPEIWHSVIDFDKDIAKYNNYFDKLEKYAENPTNWVGSGIRYEDILHQKQTVNEDNFDKYLNNYIFNEDVSYNRYTNLMVDVFQAMHNSWIVEVLWDYNTKVNPTLEDGYYADEEFDDVKSKYQQELQKFWNLIKKLKSLLWSSNSENSWNDAEPSDSALWTLPNSKFINTMFIQKVVDGFMKNYIELYGLAYFETKEKRLSLWGRYVGGTSGAKADDHITMVSKRDEISKQLLMDVNTKLEQAVDNKIEQEGYAMNVIVPTRIEVPKNGSTVVNILLWAASSLLKKVKTYEIYYFGLPAELLRNAEEFGIYRGTFNNIRSLGKLDEFDYSEWPEYGTGQSVWASRGENAREVEAHRGYDFSLIEYDQQEFDRIKNTTPYKYIKKKFKNMNKFITRYWAGYTPFNIDSDSDEMRLDQTKMDYTQLWNPFLDRSIGWRVYDIAWSRITSSDRKVGFTLGTQNEDNDDEDDSEVISNLKSYSGYSDSYLGKDFFGSAIQVTKDNGEWLKFTNWLKKYKYRNTGKPRLTNWDEINLWTLGNESSADGIFLLPDNTTFTDNSDYLQIQGGNWKNWTRYFKSVDSTFFHKSPTIEDMYGSYLEVLWNVVLDKEILCDISPPADDSDEIRTCNGYQMSLTDIQPWDVDTILYAKRADDYIVTWGKVYFNNTATWYENGITINLNGIIGQITWSNNRQLYIVYEGRGIYLPRGESQYNCELHNVEVNNLWICHGMQFTVDGHLMSAISEKYFSTKPQAQNNTLIQFFDWAKIMIQGKAIDLWGLQAIYDPNSRTALFTWTKLQIGGINEFTLERPIDSPRFVNFQGIGGSKLTWTYPNLWKVPVYNEKDGKRILKTIPEIKDSLEIFLKDKVKDYNNDLTNQYVNRFNYYNGSEDGGVPRSNWLDKISEYDYTLSPLVQADNTGERLRNYAFLQENYLIDTLATTRDGQEISSDDMLTILAEQLYYQNNMWLSLPTNSANKVLDEVSLFQSFADVNNKSSMMLQDYLTKQPAKNLLNPKVSLELQFPYYSPAGYEIAYINSDGSDYVEFESTPPLIKVIQKQQAQNINPIPKTKEQLVSTACGDKIPASYTVALSKWPAAFKCWLEEISNSPFELKVSFAGSANGILFSGLDADNFDDEILSPERKAWTGYSQARRKTLKIKDPEITLVDEKTLSNQLDNLIVSYDTKQPAVDWTLGITIQPKQNLWSYTVILSSTGANCLLLWSKNGQNTCDKPQYITINTDKKQLLAYTFSKPNGIGDMLVQIKACGQKCVYKNTIIVTQPGEIASLKFTTPLDNNILPIARGNMFPFVLLGFDVAGNKINSSLFDFILSTTNSGWVIYNNHLSNSFQFNSFMDAGFIYDSSTTVGNTEKILVQSSTPLSKVKQELTLQIVDPTLQTTPSEINITLPEESKFYEKQIDGISSIDINKLQKITLNINDGKPLYSVINFKSLWDKFIIWIKGKTTQQSVDANQQVDSFIPIDQVIHTWGSLDIYLYPKMKAGDDLIQIQIGKLIKTVPVNIQPGKPKKTVIKMEKSVTDLKTNTEALLSVTDIWWNIIYDDTSVLLWLYGNISSADVAGTWSNIIVNGERKITIQPQFPWGQSYIFATLANVSFDLQYPDYKSLLVQNRSWPIDNLNVAYVNLYWSDRSQQIDSQTKVPVGQSILANSEKTLAVTTQNVDLNSVYKSELALSNNGQIIVFGDMDLSKLGISLVNNQLGYLTPYGFLPYIDINKIGIKQTNSFDTNSSINNWNIILDPDQISKLELNIQGKTLTTKGNPLIDLQNWIIDSKIKIEYKSKFASYDLWSISYDWEEIAQMVQSYNYDADVLTQQRKNALDLSVYQVVPMNMGQRTLEGIVIQEIQSVLSDFNKGVPSIQNSNDSNFDIGFGDYFRPISNMAQGDSVGQASTAFASEFVINLGDPTYRLGDKNKLVGETDYDGSIWDALYSDPDNVVSQVIDIDRDKNGVKDLLIVYSDGRLRLLIAIGKDEYKKLGDLAVIADGIKNILIGDGDGDGYQDIFVHTLDNQLRFYKNQNGEKVDVDGYPICLDIPWWEKNLDGVYQRFLTDYNKDKVTDIVTLDKNNTIRLFLGGGNNALFNLWFGGGNYISSDKFWCDPDRRKRQKDNTSIIKSFAPQIDNAQIRDEALVHRNNLVNLQLPALDPDISSADDLEEPDKVNVDITIPNSKKPKEIINSVKNQIFDAFDPATLLQNYQASLDTTITLDSTYSPVYEPKLPEVVYKEAQSLLPTDKVDTYKIFTDLNGGRLEDGDVVKVQITIQSKWANKATYIEKLSWPREVPVNWDKQIGFFAGDLNADYKYILAPGPSYLFMIDNITFDKSKSYTFGYHVVFKSQQLVSIKNGEDATDENGINGSIGKLFTPSAYAQDSTKIKSWIDITPLDGCAKYIRRIVWDNVGSTIKNLFREVKVDLQKEIDDRQKKDENEFNNSLNDTIDNLADDSWIKDSVKNLINETWNQKWVLSEDAALKQIQLLGEAMEKIGNLNISTTLKVWGFGANVDEMLDSKIVSLTKGLCEWFKVGQKNCSGVPILSSLPWNMAFLSPWDMQVMGCKIFKDKWLPLLWFPSTLQTTFGPMPFLWPIGQKGPWDWFYRAGWWTYPSMVRIYFSPTLTAKLGIGICFWSYGLGINIPKPFKDIVGNCITFALDPGIGKCKVKDWETVGEYVINSETKQLDDTNVCNGWSNAKNSPLRMVETVVGKVDTRLNTAQGQDGLVVKLWGQANLTNYDSISSSSFFTKTKLEWGNSLDLNIKSSSDKGLVSCLLNQFADNQIRYIINNLTTLNLNIILPDLDGLANQVSVIGNSLSKSSPDYETTAQLNQEYEADKAKILSTNTWKLLSFVQSKQNLTKKLDTTLNNPFDKLSVLFSQSELIRISTKDVPVEIPRVYTEDIGKLKWVRTAWLARNKTIIDEWANFWKDIIKQCDKITDTIEKQKCQTAANDVLQINNQLGQFERSVNQNIQTIEMYGQLPKQVYELLHGYDKYIYDVFNFAYGTIDAITSWLSKVARWFDAWISFIISLTNIIKSWQILIDFTVNWKEKCSKCTVDNYSAYSCSFKWFCPSLPVFNIPPFKIPSITLDLSNLNLRTDIILPRLRFQPKKVGIFENLLQFGIPDIPYPPSMGGVINGQLNISLPKLPVIPKPPDLSNISLPSFIPQITFKGPTLPPAPKIPKIAPELGLAIDIADFIWRIFCIVKGWIGLVGEAWLKSKIEQMTQRTWNVEPFDSFKVLIPKPPLQTVNLFKPNKVEWGSFDIKLEAFADVKMYFDGIYSLFDGIADVVNDATRSVITDSDQISVVQKFIQSWEKLYNIIDDGLEKIDSTNINLNVSPFGQIDNNQKLASQAGYDFTLDTMATADSDYSSVNNKIKGDLPYFIGMDNEIWAEQRKLLAGEITRSYDYPTTTTINSKGIQDIKTQASVIMNTELKKNNELKNWVQQDYNGWLDNLANTQYVSNDENTYSLKTNVMNLDKKTLDYIEGYNLPKEYVSTQQQVINGYYSALDQSDYVTLWMQKSDYDQSKAYLGELKNNINTVQIALNQTDISSTSNPDEKVTTCTFCDQKSIDNSNNTTNRLLLSQNTSTVANGSTPSLAASDPTQYIRWYFVEGKDENYHNIVSNIDKWEEVSKRSFEKDLDNDNKKEIVFWDQHTVYIKRTTEILNDKNTFNAIVKSYVFNTIDDISNQVDKYWYIDWVKIWSENFMPKEWKVAGQSYQSLTYTVKSEMSTDTSLIWYIVRYSDNINKSYQKNADYQYIIFLDNALQWKKINSVNIDWVSIAINDSTMIQYITDDQDIINVLLKNLPRRWYFSQIAKLQSQEKNNPLLQLIPFIDKTPLTIISKSSPRSSNETAGMQIIADTSAPYADVSLIRELKDDWWTQWDNMYGNIKTYYKLEGSWFDDSKVVKSWILDEQKKIIFSGDTDAILIQHIYTDKPKKFYYTLVGQDSAWNITQKEVVIDIGLPKLSLDDVITNQLAQSQVVSSLDNDIDTGWVQFMRIRNGVESLLQSILNKKSLFETKTNQVVITWGAFWFKQDIGFYDVNGAYLNISMTPEGQIINNTKDITVKVDFIDNIPKILLMKGNLELYRIYLKPKSFNPAQWVSILNAWYTVIPLPNDVNQLNDFANGQCIKQKEGVCEILISKQGYIYISKPYHRVYNAQCRFDNWKVIYTITKWETTIAEIKLEVDAPKS